MKRALTNFLWLAVAACGDDVVPVVCEPTPPELPQGIVSDPYELPLPDDCVVGGLAELPGRWFVGAPTEKFEFFYPKFEGSCTTGFRRANWSEQDLVLDDDGTTYHEWSDGTRVFSRRYFKFEFSGGSFEYVDAFAACVLPDGTLAAVSARFDADVGTVSLSMTGTRFEPKDVDASGLSQVGELAVDNDGAPIIAYNLVVDGGLAYVVGPLGFYIIDVIDPAAPHLVSQVQGDWNDVKLARGGGKIVAYAAPGRGEETAILDVTTAAAPVQVGTIPAYSHSLFTVPGPTPRLYLADYSETVPVYDITNPMIPVRIGAPALAGTTDVGVHDLYVDGSVLFVNKTEDGLVAIDVSNGLNAPVELGRVPTSYSHAAWKGVAGGRPILIHGDEGMTGTSDGGAFMRILDGDPASPSFLAELSRYQTRPEVGIHNIQLVADLAYIAYYQDGVRVVDLSEPAFPREIAYFSTWDPETAPGQAFEGALGLRPVGDLIYIADSLRGLIIVRATP